MYDRVNLRIAGTDNGESSVDVYFNDGTILENVLAIRDNFSVYGVYTSLFLVDQNALNDAGKSINDITEISFNKTVDHNLNYADLGFLPAGETFNDDGTNDNPVEADTEEAASNIILGTSGRDNLEGTDEDDHINGKGGSRDVLTGNDGQDFFIFGTETGDNSRDRDVIVDFDTIDDTLVLENGASIASTRIKNGSTVIRLTGSDRDTIRLRGVTFDISSINIISVEGSFE